MLFLCRFLSLKFGNFAPKIHHILCLSSEFSLFTVARTANSCIAFVLVLAGIFFPAADAVFCSAAKHI